MRHALPVKCPKEPAHNYIAALPALPPGAPLSARASVQRVGRQDQRRVEFQRSAAPTFLHRLLGVRASTGGERSCDNDRARRFKRDGHATALTIIEMSAQELAANHDVPGRDHMKV
jgi:hypothetical protein